MTKIDINVQTGEITESEYTAEEIADQIAASEAKLAAIAAQLAAKNAVLEKLGLTEEEAKLLLG